MYNREEEKEKGGLCLGGREIGAWVLRGILMRGGVLEGERERSVGYL